MEYVGNVGPDGLRRGGRSAATPAGRAFTAFWLRDGRVLAGMHVNDWDAIDADPGRSWAAACPPTGSVTSSRAWPSSPAEPSRGRDQVGITGFAKFLCACTG